MERPLVFRVAFAVYEAGALEFVYHPADPLPVAHGGSAQFTDRVPATRCGV
jgi:hypothetical protein